MDSIKKAIDDYVAAQVAGIADAAKKTEKSIQLYAAIRDYARQRGAAIQQEPPNTLTGKTGIPSAQQLGK